MTDEQREYNLQAREEIAQAEADEQDALDNAVTFEMIDLESNSGGFSFPCCICKNKKEPVKYCRECPGCKSWFTQKQVENFILGSL